MKTHKPPESSPWPSRIFWIAVIAGGAWWAIREGYLPDLFRGRSTTPVIILSDGMTVGSPHSGDSTGATLSVTNEGESTVDGCQVWWYSGSQIGNELSDFKTPPASLASHSETFSLRSREVRVIRMISLAYRGEGVYPSRFVLHCTNPKFASLPADHQVTVRPR